MTWTLLETPWRSLVVDRPLDAARPPFRFATPDAAWDYGAISDSFSTTGPCEALRVRASCEQGRISLALAKPNGSILWSQEVAIAPQDGEVELYFDLRQDYGPLCLLARNYGEPGAAGRILEISLGRHDDLSADQAARLLGPADASLAHEWLPLSPSNVARIDEPMWPISLGNTCEAKVQVSRVLQFRRWPKTSQAAFRLQMLPPKRSRDVFGWDLFDWQGTPFNTLLTYLDSDFKGVFEREDLVTDGRHVEHRRLRAEHCHDFEVLLTKDEPVITDAVVDRGYPHAREQFEAMAQTFRERLTQPGPFLYVHVCEDIPSEYRTRQLIQRLSARSPDHRFHILFVGFEDEDNDLSRLSDQVSKACRPRPPEGADPTEWEGDYAAWDKALAPFTLLLPSEAPEPQPVPPLAERRGLFSFLRR
jgi:hypothetical protein